jgi:Mce-associated membrane protein
MTTLHDDIATDAPDEEIVEEGTESAEATEETEAKSLREVRRIPWSRVLAFAVLPTIALVLALVSGYFRWVVGSADDLELARTESVRAASEDAAALLSYKADTADKDLGAARERLTGEFKDAYTALIHEVVIPGAKEKHISSVAKVTAASSISASANHAVALLYVNQTVTIGDGNPTDTQPVIKVTLDKVNGRWLVSRFDPV